MVFVARSSIILTRGSVVSKTFLAKISLPRAGSRGRGVSSVHIIDPRGRRGEFQLGVIVFCVIQGAWGGRRANLIFRLEGARRTVHLSYIWGCLTSVSIVHLNANTLDTYFHQYHSVEAHIL